MVAIQIDPPAVGLDSPLRNRQPQPCAAFFSGSGFIDSVKAIEYMGSVLVRNSRTVVLNIDEGFALHRAGANFDSPARGRIFHRIVEEIDEGLPEN